MHTHTHLDTHVDAVIGILSVCPWHSFCFSLSLLLLLRPQPLTFDSKPFSRVIVAAARVFEQYLPENRTFYYRLQHTNYFTP